MSMSTLEIIAIILTIFIAYGLIVYYLFKKGYFEKYNISFYGPALLLRTKRGIHTLKRIASKKRFWRGYGTFAIIFCFLMMLFMVGMLVLNTYAILNLTPEQQKDIPGVEFGFILPGINPMLPLEYLFYVVVALIVAIIVHEFSHGILTFAHNLKVKSLGVLYFILPLGAFCEPDEEELTKTKRINRMRVYAVGPMSNFVVAIILVILFSCCFMGSVQPVDGVHVSYIYKDSPANEIGLSAGMVIQEVNNTVTSNATIFTQVMNQTYVGETIPIRYYDKGAELVKNATLVSKYNYSHNKTDKNTSFLGVGYNPYINLWTKALQHPLSFAFPNGLILLYSLPFLSYFVGFNPLVAPYNQGYVITGPLSILPPSVFWPLANVIYWVFWLNLIVGFFNILPMVPLDGGFLFSDGLRSVIGRLKKSMSEERREQIVRNITIVISFLILFIIILPWLVKYF